MNNQSVCTLCILPSNNLSYLYLDIICIEWKLTTYIVLPLYIAGSCHGLILLLALNKSQHGCVRWALCEHLTSPCHDFACGGLWNEIICLDIVSWRGAKSQKSLSRIFSPFHDFDCGGLRNDVICLDIVSWRGAKNQKIVFNQCSRHFRQFWTTLIVLIFEEKNLYAPKFFWGG